MNNHPLYRIIYPFLGELSSIVIEYLHPTYVIGKSIYYYENKRVWDCYGRSFILLGQNRPWATEVHTPSGAPYDPFFIVKALREIPFSYNDIEIHLRNAYKCTWNIPSIRSQDLYLQSILPNKRYRIIYCSDFPYQKERIEYYTEKDWYISICPYQVINPYCKNIL